MADTLILARTELQPGTRNLGPASIPQTIIAAGLVIDKTNWTDPNVKLSCQYEVSLNGGQTWIPKGGFVNEPGGSGSSVFFVFGFPEPTNPNRRARATLTVTGGVCDISASIRLLDGTEPDPF